MLGFPGLRRLTEVSVVLPPDACQDICVDVRGISGPKTCSLGCRPEHEEMHLMVSSPKSACVAILDEGSWAEIQESVSLLAAGFPRRPLARMKVPHDDPRIQIAFEESTFRNPGVRQLCFLKNGGFPTQFHHECLMNHAPFALFAYQNHLEGYRSSVQKVRELRAGARGPRRVQHSSVDLQC